MFIPGEAFFPSAIETDLSLLEQAIEKQVLLSTPTTLIALLKAISFGWQQETFARNPQTIAEQARDLFRRIATLGEYIENLGRSLQKTVSHHNRSIRALEHRILPTARKFEQLGAASAGYQDARAADR